MRLKMRMKLATKIWVAIAGMVALAVTSSVVALISSWWMEGLLVNTIGGHRASALAAEELESSLLEQKGFVSSYMLDPENRTWLEQLDVKKQMFGQWLAAARRAAHTAEETDLLDNIEGQYRQYDAKRQEAISLWESGQHDRATTLFLTGVRDSYQRVYKLCEKFITADQQFVEREAGMASSAVGRVTWLVGICVALTVLLGAALLWMLFMGVLVPLRKMVSDARAFAGNPQSGGAKGVADELDAVGVYLRTLMDSVQDTQSTLEASRNRLMNAEKLASVGKLAASVAHEIRNPLTAVKMWLFSLRKSVGSGPELDHKFAVISEEIARLESIIRNFLEFARPPAAARRPQDLSSLIDKTAELIGSKLEAAKIRLVRHDAAPAPTVMADPEQIEQVFINLLDNAAEAMGEGGEIRVSSSAESAPDGSPMGVVRIADNGPGMPKELRDRVFEPFFTSKENGTGLGLCIAARIMAQHQGRLVLETSTSEGTTFAVWIPLARNDDDEPNPGS